VYAPLDRVATGIGPVLILLQRNYPDKILKYRPIIIIIIIIIIIKTRHAQLSYYSLHIRSSPFALLVQTLLNIHIFLILSSSCLLVAGRWLS